jgi:hypothetical protein
MVLGKKYKGRIVNYSGKKDTSKSLWKWTFFEGEVFAFMRFLVSSNQAVFKEIRKVVP